MTIPYYDYAGIQIVMARKLESDSNMFYFLTVFTLYVWLCIGATLFITGILVTVFDKLSPYSFQNKTEWEEGEPEGKIFTIKESMWFVLGAYTMAGETVRPNLCFLLFFRSTSRLDLVCWGLCCYVIPLAAGYMMRKVVTCFVDRQKRC